MKTFGIVGSLIAAMAFFVLLFSKPSPTSNAAATVEPSSVKSREIRAQDKMDSQLFSDLTPGVTTLSVMGDYLEAEGELVSSTQMAGISTKSYVLRNSDGSTVSLLFQNGILAAKRQSGLE